MRSRYGSEPLHDPEPYEVAPGETCDCGSALVLVEGERVCLRCWVVVEAEDVESVREAAE